MLVKLAKQTAQFSDKGVAVRDLFCDKVGWDKPVFECFGWVPLPLAVFATQRAGDGVSGDAKKTLRELGYACCPRVVDLPGLPPGMPRIGPTVAPQLAQPLFLVFPASHAHISVGSPTLVAPHRPHPGYCRWERASIGPLNADMTMPSRVTSCDAVIPSGPHGHNTAQHTAGALQQAF